MQLILTQGLLPLPLPTCLYSTPLCIYTTLIFKTEKMKVQVNNKEIEINISTTVAQLADKLELPSAGVAVAVNNQMLPRTEWNVSMLQENDNIVVIKAACGG
jgi:sulfur carrier protein